jgi:hypothetical protein
MKPGLALKSFIVLNVFLVAVLAFLMAEHVPSPPRRSFFEATNNPNNFCLWKNETGITYNFRYDPHAADVWRFKSGPELKALVHNASAENAPANPTR